MGKLREMTILTPEGENKGSNNGQVRSKALSATQYEAIDLLVLRGKEKMTKGAIADKLGINPRTLRRWEQDPMFIAEYKRLVVQATTSRMPEILNALTDAVIEDRSAAAAKLLLQINGMLTQSVEVKQVDKHIDRDDLERRLNAIRQDEGRTLR